MSDTHQLAQAVRHLLAALVRTALPQSEADAEPARAEARRRHAAARDLAGDADPAALKLDGLWTAAVSDADTPELEGMPLRVSPQTTSTCPLSADDLLAPELDLPAIEDRIRAATSTG